MYVDIGGSRFRRGSLTLGEDVKHIFASLADQRDLIVALQLAFDGIRTGVAQLLQLIDDGRQIRLALPYP